MRVWLELNQVEGELLFDTVKTFMVDRLETAVASAPKSTEEKEIGIEQHSSTPIRESIHKPELGVSLQEVRAVLAEKSQSGKHPEVKALIAKYGANKLTEVDPSQYANLLKEAQKL